MNSLSPETFLIFVLAGGVVLFVISFWFAWRVFQRVVDHEHAFHHESWQKDGKPIGSKRARRERSFWSIANPEHGLFYAWYRETPEWAAGDLVAIALIRSFRRYAFAGLAALVTTIVVFILALVLYSVHSGQ